MLHSKIYFMELPEGNACAFIGSHNVTSFALTGLNGEAAVLLEGATSAREFDLVSNHIAEARRQAVAYSPAMKEAFAFWTREFVEGMKAEIQIPRDWTIARTIVIFAIAAKGLRPQSGDYLYFEIPAGIEQIESLRTETHLFLFDALPKVPQEALSRASAAHTSFVCDTIGAENERGNLEVVANWRIDGNTNPVLTHVPSGRVRPVPSNGMQQVRARAQSSPIPAFEYLFDRDKAEWDPVFANTPALYESELLSGTVSVEGVWDRKEPHRAWNLVSGLRLRSSQNDERDAKALKLAAPESGSFVLVSLRRRRKGRSDEYTRER
jgi:hypothetical protein